MACSRPPQIPELAGTDPLPLERIILRDELRYEDLRALFRAINQNGRLDALKPYVEDASDSALAPVTELVSEHFYRHALDTDGFPALLNRRGPDTGAMLEWADRWARSPGSGKEREALWSLLSHSRFPQLAEGDVGFLAPRWMAMTADAWNAAGKSWRDDTLLGPMEPFSSSSVVEDVRRWSADPTARAAFERLVLKALENGSPVSLLRQLERAQKTDGLVAFKGFSYGVAKQSRPENSLERLLELARLLDGPSDGLFLEAQKKIRDEPDTGRELATFFQPNLSSAVAGLIKDAMGRGSARNFLEWFVAVRSGIESITGLAKPDSAPDYLIANLPIFLPSYVLARWLDESTKIPKNAALWERIKREGFTETVWMEPFQAPKFTVDFLEQRRDRPDGPLVYHLNRGIHDELDKLGLDRFAALLDAGVREEGLGQFGYGFTPEENASTFGDAFARAVRTCESVRPYGDAAAYLRALIARFTRPGSPPGRDSRELLLESWESPNVMDSVHRLLTFLGPDGWPSFRRLVFDDFGFARLSPDNRRLIQSLYDRNPKLKERVGAILDRLGSLEALDTPAADGLPSALHFYLRILGGLGRDDVGTATALLRFGADSRLFAHDGREPVYPGILSLVAAGKPATRLLWGLAHVPPRQSRLWLAPIEEWLEPSRKPALLGLHLDVLEDWLAKHQIAAAGLIERWRQPHFGLGAGPSLAPFSDGEYRWLARFVREGALARLFAFCHERGNRAEAGRLVDQLLALSASGALRDGFRHLTQIRNERMQRLALALAHWDERGELAAFLKVLRLVLVEFSPPRG